ncbi:hypothetical protein SAMN05443572_112166 [Myxococcus fulvus]|uniref:Lipoprotein n=1 Tax=Myxococcus fulvus TaxID=33 RepID=A0ABY1CTM2_MYXFU|nr:hypothetical protein SAMN05443572_112166 [Myxococcus fulvus]
MAGPTPPAILAERPISMTSRLNGDGVFWYVP